MDTNGAYQDLFVILMNKELKDGWYIEIGSNHPMNSNNSYILENKYGWKGIMVELDGSFLQLYKEIRPLAIPIIGDATQIDYVSYLQNNNFPANLNYLQIDVEADNKSTLDTIKLFDNSVFDHYKFGTVTFEHDIYRGDFFDTRSISREIFLKRGYVRLFSDVCVWVYNTWCPYEDWYVHPDIIDNDLIQKILSDPENTEKIHTTTCIEIIQRYLKK